MSPASSAPTRFDVAVIGAGPAGMTAALLFARRGFATALVAPQVNLQDARTTALLEASVRLLRSLDLWDALEPRSAPLAHMRLIDDTGRLIRAPEVTFDAAELGLEAFGYNILNRDLNAVLMAAVEAESGLTWLQDTAASVRPGADRVDLSLASGTAVAARLVVGADGRESLVREAAGIATRRWTYPQKALVLNLDHSRPHSTISTEFHTPTGPFTLVPLPGCMSSLVCVVEPETADRLAALDDAALARELERRAHSILGAFTIAGTRQLYPLSGLVATSVASARCALVGEAAHVFPPIGAQGLNLGLRDVADLVETVDRARRRGEDIGGAAVLARYEATRRSDIASRTAAVDLLNRSLLSGFLPVQALRSVGLYLAGRIGPLRRLLMREGITPRAARLAPPVWRAAG
nr:UbiH/UbiF family hydroxylase [Polymorphum gilvum]